MALFGEVCCRSAVDQLMIEADRQTRIFPDGDVPVNDTWFHTDVQPLHRWDKTKLLEHTKPVIKAPVFHNLAARDASDLDGRDRHLLPGWGDTPKHSLLRAMRCKAGDDLIPFRDHVLDGDMQDGETSQHHGYRLPGSLGTDR